MNGRWKAINTCEKERKRRKRRKRRKGQKKVDGWRELGRTSGMVKGRGCD